MSGYKPVTISKGSFAFCRFSVAILLWSGVALQSKELIVLTTAILLLSYILKVGRAPMIVLYKFTIDKLFPTEGVLVDEKGIQFAHLVGTIVGLAACLVLYFVNDFAGWIITIVLAILKTSAAFGFCSALKLYSCMTGGNCCRVGLFARRIKKNV